MRLDDKNLARKLRDVRAPEPPPDLLQRLKDDIDLEGGIDAETRRATGRESRPPRRWAAAASLVALLGAGFFAYRIVQEAPPLVESPAEPVPVDEGQASSPASEPEGPTDALRQRIDDVEPRHDDSAARRSAPEVVEEKLESRSGERIGAEELGRAAEISAEWPGESVSVAPPPSPPALTPRPKPSTPPAGRALEKKTASMDAAGTVPDRAMESAGLFQENEERSLAVREQERRELERQLAELEGSDAERSRRLAVPDPAPAPPARAPAPAPAQGGEGAEFDEIVITSEALPARGAAATSDGFGHDGAEEESPAGDPDTMFFRDYGTNPWTRTRDDARSTFGLDVDTGSFTLARRYLADGRRPPREAVRVEEIVNALRYPDLPAPRTGDFSLRAEFAPSPWSSSDGDQLLRFTVRGREVTGERRPTDLVLVIDTSGSMNRENRLGLVRRSLEMLIEELGPRDRLALVTYGSRGRVILEPTRDRRRVLDALAELTPSGSTNAEEGLVLAYDLAARTAREGVVQRLILCSDGVANVGRTGPESILDRIGEEARSGVELSTVGFGMGNYNDVLMEQLADRGDGRYAYVDRLDEARRLFVEELTGTLQTIGYEARAQVELNPDLVESYRLLGYENRDIADHRFRDDDVDAGEIGVGHTVTALYEIRWTPEARVRLEQGGEVATLRLRYRPADADRFRELEHRVTAEDGRRRLAEASIGWQLAATAAELAEILRGVRPATGEELGDLAARAEDLAGSVEDSRAGDLVEMIRRLRVLVEAGAGEVDWD